MHDIEEIGVWAAQTLWIASEASGYTWTKEQIGEQAMQLVNSFPTKMTHEHRVQFIKAVLKRGNDIVHGKIRVK